LTLRSTFPTALKEITMLAFEVADMSCGHCVGTITKALQGADPAARVSVDLGRHLVMVESAASGALLGQAIAEAGYTPVPVPVQPAPSSAPASGRGCCGGC
jgi:copper chaperone